MRRSALLKRSHDTVPFVGGSLIARNRDGGASDISSTLNTSQDFSVVHPVKRPKTTLPGPHQPSGGNVQSTVQKDQEACFVAVLQACGVDVTVDEIFLSETADIYAFRNGLAKALTTTAHRENVDPNQPSSSRAQSFVSGFTAWTALPAHLHLALLPLQGRKVRSKSPASSSSTLALHTSFGTSDSLARILLFTPSIQTKVATVLLDRLVENFDVTIPSTANTSSSSGLSLHDNVPKLIINLFRWLDHVENPTVMAEKMLEILEMAPRSIQIMLIEALPEILDDAQTEMVATRLQSLMDQDTSLTVCILSALSDLELSTNIAEQIQASALPKLASCATQDLPVIIRFLFHSSGGNTESAGIMLMEFREKFEFDSVFVSNGESRNSKEQGDIYLIFDALKSIGLYPNLLDAWIKIFGTVGMRWKDLDVMMLFVMYAVSSVRKKIESSMKRVIRTGLLNQSIIESILSRISFEFFDYFESALLSMAEFLLCCGTPAHTEVARIMYCHAFRTLGDHKRQDVIGTLVTHVGSGAELEIQAALRVILSLSEKYPQQLVKFTIFLKNVLDYVDQLSSIHIRQLFDIFAELMVDRILHPLSSGSLSSSMSSLNDPNSSMSEVHMYLQKQLGCLDPKFKHIGVIGTLAIICRLGREQEKVCIIDCIQLLDALHANCKGSPNSLSQIYDELSFVISRDALHSKVVAWICENIAFHFTKRFFLDAEAELGSGSPSSRASPLPGLSYAKALAIDLEGDIDIVIAPLLFQDPTLLCIMCPLWKLFQTCARAMQGNLSQIDLILEAGIILFEQNMELLVVKTELTQDARHALLSSIFVAVNWLIELVNAFVHEVKHDETALPALFKRIQQILDLERWLETLLPLVPDWSPEELGVFGEQKIEYLVADWNGTVEAGQVSLEVHDHGSVTSQTTAKTAKSGGIAKKKFKKTAVFSLASLRTQHFREFDLSVLDLLSHAAQNVDNLSQVLFLLDGLGEKISYKLPRASGSSPPGFGRKKRTTQGSQFSSLDRYSSRECLMLIVPTIQPLMSCLILCAFEFKKVCSMDSDSTESRDQANTTLDIPENVSKCFRKISSIFKQLFESEELSRSSNEDVCELILTALIHDAEHGLPTSAVTQSQRDDNLAAICQKAFRKLIAVFPDICTGSLFVAYYQMIKSLFIFMDDKDVDLRAKMASNAAVFVQTAWSDQRTLNYDDLQDMMECTILYFDEPCKIIETILGIAIPALKTGDEEVLIDYPLLNQETLLTFYKAALSSLVKVMGSFDPDDIQAHHESAGDNASTILIPVLKGVHQFATCFKCAVEVIRIFDTRFILAVLLKQSAIFLSHFVKRVCPVFKVHFKQAPDDVVLVLKSLQQGTRLLQSVCSESKVSGDSMIMSHVPSTRRALESLLYEVKKLLEDNHCLNAFWVGNLKHRAIDGSVISSQWPVEPDANDEEEVVEEKDEAKGEGERNLPANHIVRRIDAGIDLEAAASSDQSTSDNDEDNSVLYEEEEGRDERRGPASKKARNIAIANASRTMDPPKIDSVISSEWVENSSDEDDAEEDDED